MMFLLAILRLGLTNLMLHKLRSMLTVLGIIIGVGAVVAIAAYGEGSKQAALANIRRLGATNIILRSRKPPESADSGEARQRLSVYGLKRLDARRVEATVPRVQRVVPLKQVESRATHGEHRVASSVFGTTPDLLKVTSLRVARGRFLIEQDENTVAPVVVLGADVAAQLFPLEDPLDKTIDIDQQDFKVVGVLEPMGIAGGAGAALVGRNLNFDIYMPMATAMSRFGDILVERVSGQFKMEQVELTELYVQADDEQFVKSIADQVRLIVELEHAGKADYEITVPLELLEIEAQTQQIFNVMMIIIGGLSLLVGGIGIMNIMLATVTERTREIGIRRAVGATRRHIIAQFLVETTVLSGVGGVIGVALGAASAVLITVLRAWDPARFAKLVEPVVLPESIVISFSVAVAVGIIFGLYPAVRAAQQDPIVALRHD